MSKDCLLKMLDAAKESKDLKEESASNKIIFVLALLGGIVAVACIAYAVYRFLTPDYYEDYDEEFDDEFDDDFEDDEEEEEKADIPIQA